MDPQNIPISTIFGLPMRYTVPLFQRPYVWQREEQWQPLWDDIKDLAGRLLTASSQDKVAPHYLGTAVFEPVSTDIGKVPSREIIDGQQRLTTLQLFLKAAEHAVKGAAQAASGDDEIRFLTIAAAQIAKLTANTDFYEETEKYKVWPTNDDRSAFQAVVDAQNGKDVVPQKSRMADAYRFFAGELQSWLALGNAPERARALSGAMHNHLRLIVLNLDHTDEPQAIFETLNAHGTPLLPSDLIKNWVVWECKRQGKDENKLYESYWRDFDADDAYWRAKVGSGHAARFRIDLFFQNWLTLRTLEFVPPKHLYSRFLTYAGGHRGGAGTKDIEALLADIALFAGLYRKVENGEGKTRFAKFLQRLKIFDFAVFQPVLMLCLSRPACDANDLDRVAVCMESVLLRRMVCRENTRQYGTTAVRLVEAVSSLPDDAPASPAIADYIRTHDDFALPSDEKFRALFTTEPFYGWFRRDRVVMILQAIEERRLAEGGKGEPVISFDYPNMQVEHILPQTWDENHWPLPEGIDRVTRDQRVHWIGNLTLVSKKLNPALSNVRWLDWEEGGDTHKGKRQQLVDHTVLKSNLTLAKDYENGWDDNTIVARGGTLFAEALKIWPSSFD